MLTARPAKPALAPRFLLLLIQLAASLLIVVGHPFALGVVIVAPVVAVITS